MDALIRQISLALVLCTIAPPRLAGAGDVAPEVAAEVTGDLATAGGTGRPGAPAPHPGRVMSPSADALVRLHHPGIDLLDREWPPRAASSTPTVTAAAISTPGSGTELGYARLMRVLDGMRLAYPDIVGERISLGKTWEGRDLWAVKISDHPDIDEDEPEVLYDALHHARESTALETLLRAMWSLVSRYDTDPEIRHLVDERELWFVPMVNPDGYVANRVGGMWRKNRRPNPDGSFGVDLNRNYDCRFAEDDRGSSPEPASQTYRGPRAFSEPETRAMRDFMLSHRFVTGMTLHAFSDINLLPGGRGPSKPARWQELCEVGEDLEALTGYPYGRPWELLYVSNGRSQDWAHEVAGILMIEPEIGRPEDGFWPGAERLDELAAQNLPGILHIARIAGAHLAVERSEVIGDSGADRAPDPGDRVTVAIELRNKGYADAREIEATLHSHSVAARVISGPRKIVTAPARTTLPATRLTFDIELAADTVEGLPLEFELALRGADGYVGSDIVTLVAGRPRLVFADDAEHGSGRWRTTQGWGVIELGPADADAPAPAGSSAHGRAFTDSPHGTYAARADNALELRQPIDLGGFTAARLDYRERYVVEPWADRCLVEASVDGRHWTTVATGSGGAQHRFRDRQVDLASFAGARSVLLRFRLLSNGAHQKDGWTVDDIRVWGFAPEQTLAAGITPPASTDPVASPATSLTIESE